jgi:hypothetical protein
MEHVSSAQLGNRPRLIILTASITCGGFALCLLIPFVLLANWGVMVFFGTPILLVWCVVCALALRFGVAENRIYEMTDDEFNIRIPNAKRTLRYSASELVWTEGAARWESPEMPQENVVLICSCKSPFVFAVGLTAEMRDKWISALTYSNITQVDSPPFLRERDVLKATAVSAFSSATVGAAFWWASEMLETPSPIFLALCLGLTLFAFTFSLQVRSSVRAAMRLRFAHRGAVWLALSIVATALLSLKSIELTISAGLFGYVVGFCLVHFVTRRHCLGPSDECLRPPRRCSFSALPTDRHIALFVPDRVVEVQTSSSRAGNLP